MYPKHFGLSRPRLRIQTRSFDVSFMLGYLTSPSKTTMPTEKSPLTVGGKPTAYFMERAKSINTKAEGTAISESHVDVEEHETLPEGSAPNQFTPRPVASIASVQSGAPPTKAGGLFGGLFGKKSNAVHSLDAFPRKAPVKVDPKVFFANERTFLAWMHVSVILAGASVAIVAFADAQSAAGQLYGVILLPVSISFIVYAMMQCK